MRGSTLLPIYLCQFFPLSPDNCSLLSPPNTSCNYSHLIRWVRNLQNHHFQCPNPGCSPATKRMQSSSNAITGRGDWTWCEEAGKYTAAFKHGKMGEEPEEGSGEIYLSSLVTFWYVQWNRKWIWSTASHTKWNKWLHRSLITDSSLLAPNPAKDIEIKSLNGLSEQVKLHQRCCREIHKGKRVGKRESRPLSDSLLSCCYR